MEMFFSKKASLACLQVGVSEENYYVLVATHQVLLLEAMSWGIYLSHYLRINYLLKEIHLKIRMSSAKHLLSSYLYRECSLSIIDIWL